MFPFFLPFTLFLFCTGFLDFFITNLVPLVSYVNKEWIGLLYHLKLIMKHSYNEIHSVWYRWISMDPTLIVMLLPVEYFAVGDPGRDNIQYCPKYAQLVTDGERELAIPALPCCFSSRNKNDGVI